MRKYTVSVVWIERRVTSVEPPGKFFPPTALKLSGLASFHAGPSAGSIGGGAPDFLETSTFCPCASTRPPKGPAASATPSAIAMTEIREYSMYAPPRSLGDCPDDFSVSL